MATSGAAGAGSLAARLGYVWGALQADAATEAFPSVAAGSEPSSPVAREGAADGEGGGG